MLYISPHIAAALALEHAQVSRSCEVYYSVVLCAQVSRDEFSRAMRVLGLGVSEEQLTALYAQFDNRGNGGIDFKASAPSFAV